MRRVANSLAWIAAALLPLLVVAALVVQANRLDRLRERRGESRRLAGELAALLDASVGVAARQLRVLAELPSLQRALASRDAGALAEQVEFFRADPGWIAIAAVSEDGALLHTTGVLDRALATPPFESQLTLLASSSLEPPRARVVAPVAIGPSRGWLVGIYSMADLVPVVLGEEEKPQVPLVTTADGRVVLGPLPVVGLELRMLGRAADEVRVELGPFEGMASVEPALGGRAQVVSMYARATGLAGSGPALIGLGIAFLFVVAYVVAWQARVARTERRLGVRERELLALHELAVDATVTPHRRQVLVMASARAAQLVAHAEAAAVALGTPSPERVSVVITYPHPAREPVLLPAAGDLLLARALQHGRRETGRPSWTDEAWRSLGLGAGGWACWTPLVAHGRVLGALGLFSPRERAALDVDESRLIDGLAATLAVALESQERMAELLRQRAMLATVVDSSPDGVLAVDAQERVILDNPAMRQTTRLDHPLIGLTVAELLERVERIGGRLDFDFVPAELLARSRAGATARGSLRLRFEDDVRSMESITAPLPLPSGETGTLVALRDVSERAELAQVRKLHLRVSSLARQASARAALLEQVLAATDVGMVFLDREGRVAFANARFGELLGIPPPARGLHREELEAQVAGRVVPTFGGLREDGRLVTREPGRRALALRSVEVTDEDGRPLGRLASLRDETAQRELDEAREALIAVAAHELKNPLAVLRIQAELGLRDRPRREDALRRILARTAELQQLVEGMLDVTRAELGKLKLERSEVALLPLVREAAEPFVAQGAEISVAGEPELRILADELRLRQVVGNLISNAARYAGEGPIEAAVSRSDGEARIAVRDHGPGIAPEDRATIFERFGQGRRADRGPGLGIGLYLSRLIVEAHGGRLELESELGVGSTFTAVLPAPEPGAGAPDYGAGAATQLLR